MRVKVPLVLAKVASPPWKVLITAIPSSCEMSWHSEAAGPSFSCERSHVTAWFSSSFLGTPIWLLKFVMMLDVLLFGVSWSVFLSHPARQYGVSALGARLLAFCGFGGHSRPHQFRSLIAPALPCPTSEVHRMFLPRASASTFVAHKDGHSCAQVL